MIGIDFNFIKMGQMDKNEIIMKGRAVNSPELKANIFDSNQDFDIRGLHCHIHDINLEVYIHCQCH